MQVAGHLGPDGSPTTFLDSAGRLHKQLQAGPRGDREIAFYQCAQRARTGPEPPGGIGSDRTPACEHQLCPTLPSDDEGILDVACVLRNGALAADAVNALRRVVHFIPPLLCAFSTV